MNACTACGQRNDATHDDSVCAAVVNDSAGAPAAQSAVSLSEIESLVMRLFPSDRWLRVTLNTEVDRIGGGGIEQGYCLRVRDFYDTYEANGDTVAELIEDMILALHGDDSAALATAYDKVRQ